MKKLTILTGLLTLFLTSFLTMDLKAQWYVYGDMVVYGNSEMRKNLDVDSTITTLYIIVDSIKINDSTIIGSYSGTLASVSFVNDQIGAIVFYDRDSVYQYEQDSSIARQEMLYNRDSVLAYEIDSSLVRATDLPSYSNALTETAGVVTFEGDFTKYTEHILNGYTWGILSHASAPSNGSYSEIWINDNGFDWYGEEYSGGTWTHRTNVSLFGQQGLSAYNRFNSANGERCDYDLDYSQHLFKAYDNSISGSTMLLYLTPRGAYFGADYSSLWSTERYIPDLAWVRNEIGDSVQNNKYTFDNGLTETAGTVDLGNFTKHTTIDGGGFNYDFETLNSGYGGGLYFHPTTPATSLYMEASSSRKEITMAYTSGGISVADNIDNMGFIYNADYSSGAPVRWCTDRAYVDSYYSGSLTDGAPTDAEIDGIIGSTPSAVKAGRKFLIKDTDGTGLYYDIISDGSNWIYFPGKAGTTAT